MTATIAVQESTAGNRQQCDSSVSKSEFSGSGADRIAQAHQ